ncbi:MAG: MBL fold metallo-hydrolase [Desulfotalea sp.]
MKVKFWGARGSIPASYGSDKIRGKIFNALKVANGKSFSDDQAIHNFIDKEISFETSSSYGSNTSCVQVGDNIILDAGSGLRDFGQQIVATKPTGNTFHIFLSHLHWDHIQGFPFFVPVLIKGNKIHIYGCHENIKESLSIQQQEPFFPISFDMLQADIFFHKLDVGKPIEVEGYEVNSFKQNHPQTSYGYRVSKNDKSMVYSTDAEHLEDSEQEDYPFLKFIENTDLLIFDAQYNLADHFHVKSTWGHSSNLMGVELAVRAGAKRLCMFHSEHGLDDTSLHQFLKDSVRYKEIYARDAAVEVLQAYDGYVIEL